MGQTDRLYKLKSWFDAGRRLTKADLLSELEISSATLKRDFSMLRDRLNAPISYDREQRHWYLDRQQPQVGQRYELPGLWLNAQEIHALLTMQHLLGQLDVGGLLGPHIDPLAERLGELLAVGVPNPAQIAQLIRVDNVASRQFNLPSFQTVGSALLQRRRLLIRYVNKGDGVTSSREVSPQRLVHYRGNWHLEAWCHMRGAMRNFGVDAMAEATVLESLAIEVSVVELDQWSGSGYGIFSGSEVQWATLRFSADRARWVSVELWHPQQRGAWDEDGSWLLEIPYANERELVMDILRHVPEVEVLAPPMLQALVIEKLEAGLRKQAPGHLVSPPRQKIDP